MTYEEAINLLDPVTFNGNLSSLEMEEACRIACEAMAMQIPLKLEKAKPERPLLLCGKCRSYIGYIERKLVFGMENKFCWSCGQALDWSDVK